MISPVVQIAPNAYAAKAEQYCTHSVSKLPAREDGWNATTWALTFGRAADWTAAIADSQIEFLFPVPGSVDTADELRAFLRSRTIGDLTGPQRTNLQAILDNHGVNRADFTLATTGAQVMKRVVAALEEQDFGFGMNWHF